MDLRSGYPYSLIKNGLPANFPKLDKDIKTDVVVIGAGITGSIMRYYLLKAGIECVTVDSRTIGLGSTCASTSLLQYEIDTPLSEMIATKGKAAAERAYHLCGRAIKELAKIADEIGFTDFEFCPSVYFAAYKKDVGFLETEFQARRAGGFDVHFLNSDELASDYKLNSPGAIRSELGALTDAYMFTHALLNFKRSDSNVYDRTKIVKTRQEANKVVLETDLGFTIAARKIIYATGYEIVETIGDGIVNLVSTYAIVSEQYPKSEFWRDNAMFWGTGDPYLYIRTTSDGRIIVGGRDEPFYSPARRDALVGKKTKQLQTDFLKSFPDLEFRTEFSWSGTFGTTMDGLPYIGEHPKFRNCFFALGFGGNGITFSQVAAEIIADSLQKKRNPDAELFSFSRK